jgi:hypothetical protein
VPEGRLQVGTFEEGNLQQGTATHEMKVPSSKNKKKRWNSIEKRLHGPIYDGEIMDTQN